MIKNEKSDTQTPISSSVEQSQNIFDTLPEEIILEIFKHLGAYDLDPLKLVNHTWNRLTNDEQLWRQLGLKIGLSKNDLKENPEARVKQEIKKIKGQAKAAGIVNPSLNTPDEINHVKLQIDYKNLQKSNTPPQHAARIYSKASHWTRDPRKSRQTRALAAGKKHNHRLR